MSYHKIHFHRLMVEAGGSLLRSGQTQVGEPKVGEHAQ
jgi:hypothetical protein